MPRECPQPRRRRTVRLHPVRRRSRPWPRCYAGLEQQAGAAAVTAGAAGRCSDAAIATVTAVAAELAGIAAVAPAAAGPGESGTLAALAAVAHDHSAAATVVAGAAVDPVDAIAAGPAVAEQAGRPAVAAVETVAPLPIRPPLPPSQAPVVQAPS